MAKILILSQNTLHPEYLLMDIASRLTWQLYEDPDVLIKPYYGCLNKGEPMPQHECDVKQGVVVEANGVLLYGGEDTVVRSPICSFKTGDFNKMMDPRGDRFIHVLEYCFQNYEFDYMLRTGTGYYIDVVKLQKYIELLPSEKVYTGAVFCGPNPDSRWGHVFVAGANCLMSRDVVEKLVEHKDLYLKISEKAPEDAATGMVLHDEVGYVSPCVQLPNHRLQAFYHNNKSEDILLLDDPYLYNYKLFPHQYKEFMSLHYQVIKRDDSTI